MNCWVSKSDFLYISGNYLVCLGLLLWGKYCIRNRLLPEVVYNSPVSTSATLSVPTVSGGNSSGVGGGGGGQLPHPSSNWPFVGNFHFIGSSEIQCDKCIFNKLYIVNLHNVND